MTIGELLEHTSAIAPLVSGSPVPEEIRRRPVSGLAYDSRAVAPDAVFFALRGQRADGTAFATEAVARGAVVVVSEERAPENFPGPWLTTPDARLALAAAAAEFFRHPSERLVVIGITGTNGKTTTAYLLESVLEAAGMRCGRLGTVSYRVGDDERVAVRTTPEAPDVQALLQDMTAAGCVAAVLEVSSHALSLRRVDGTRFSAGVFTNLTRDHLDFHHGMEEYFLAKRRLFELLPAGAPAVVNGDDPYGARLKDDLPAAVTFGFEPRADVAPLGLTLTLHGLDFEAKTPRGVVHVRSRLAGRPNAYNILATVATATALDLPFEAIQAGIETLHRVPGRFQLVSDPADDIAVIVDYAHTDDALRNLLETTRPLARGRLVTVFGCGGDRDRTKRPLMGAVAARLSDLVIVTSDNPRSEDPDAIIEDIKRGIVQPDRPPKPGAAPVLVPPSVRWLAIADREAAIARAVREAEPGDLVVIAGKGHEQYQEIAGIVVPFDDVTVAGAALAARRERTGGEAEVG
jgi:UDP-N-acetylmuramoyl-L-alanyl-D-glutamate--2,6-diaminopimelate ligase